MKYKYYVDDNIRNFTHKFGMNVRYIFLDKN